jgi:hypothetical protein
MYAYLLPFCATNYLMGIGAWSFYSRTNQEQITVGSLVGIVCFISSVCAMIGACEKSMISVNGKNFLWCRLLEYTLNAPLLTAIMAESFGVNPHKVLRLTSLTASYCLCGFGAVLSKRFWLKVYFVALGCLIYLFVTVRLLQVSRNPPHVSRVATINLYMSLISYPIVVFVWGASDVFELVDPKKEFFIETMLMVVIKTFSLLYVLGDEEYYKLSHQIWEAPQQTFYIARSVIYNHH